MDREIKPKTILCIPGMWKDQSEIVRSIAINNIDEFLFAGKLLMNIKTKQHFVLEIEEYDDRMKEAFRFAGRVNHIPDEFLEKIDQHTCVVYIIGDTGSLIEAKAISEAGRAILMAGGIGLKVETTGKAFTAEHWTSLVTDFKEANLYEMFVLDSITDGTTVYSCGMHNLGFKDTIVSNLEFQESVDLLSLFGYYQLIDKPDIRDGQTFSADQDAPVFEISHEPNQPNEGYELFENPFGMWRLTQR